MSKISLTKPILIMLYGFPGSGKTYFANNLSNSANIAHLHSEKIRSELFTKPNYSDREDLAVKRIMDYLAKQLLSAGVSVAYDNFVGRKADRSAIKGLAKELGVGHMLVWVQIDPKSALNRVLTRDKRKSDDKYSPNMDKVAFEQYLAYLQNPNDEDYLVISGKHAPKTQLDGLLKRLYSLGLLDTYNASQSHAKPGLVNLVPASLRGRVDNTRRNISVR